MRRIFIFLTLLLILAAVYRLDQISDDWHYIVPAEPGTLIYATTFDAPVDDWEQFEGRGFARINEGMMHLGVEDDNTQIYSASAHYFDDFDLTLAAQAVGGDVNNGFGIVFRQKNRSNFYTFLISSDGYYRVTRRVDGIPKILSNWHPSDIINQGIGDVNEIRVIGDDDRFQFYVNGQQLDLCVPDSPDGESTPNNFTGECVGGQWLDTLVDDSIDFGRIGVTLAVEGQPTGPEIAFDNVVIYGPQPIE